MSESNEKVVLVIAGSDPSGGAGVQADIKTLSDCGTKGVYAITAITAQSDESVVAIHPTPADLLTQQLSTACRNREIAAVKIGMVATQTNIRAIIWFLQHTPVPHIVIDPILHSSSGAPLLENKAIALYRQQLLPLATVITPNLFEASTLAGMQVSRLDTMRSAAEAIHHEVSHFRAVKERSLAVIVKGGHLEGDATDILYDGLTFSIFSAQRIPGKSPRGTGCRFSSAIAAYLAQGCELRDSVKRAKEYLGTYITGQRDRNSGE